MKIVAISDPHTMHKLVTIPECDVLICSGDISTRGYKQEIINFLNWFDAQPATHKIFIAGNHDFFFDSQWRAHTTVGAERHKHVNKTEEEINELLVEYPNIIYLNDSGVTIDGVNFWGSPVQPWFHDWAFNRDEEGIKPHWNLIPENTNILITHGPPRGYGDQTVRTYEKVGCKSLHKAIWNNPNIKVNIYGHIHEGYGVIQDGDKFFMNASVLNENYEMINDPIFFNYDEPTKHVEIIKV